MSPDDVSAAEPFITVRRGDAQAEVPEVLISEQWVHFHDWPDTEADLALIERLLAPRPGGMLADLGCGRGRLAIPLAQKGVRVIGVDASRRLLAAAREALGARSLDLTFEEGDIRDLSRWRDTFDSALSWWQVFGYATDAETVEMFGEIRRSLVPGGRFLLHQPTARWLENIPPEGRGFEYSRGRDHARCRMTADRERSVVESHWKSRCGTTTYEYDSRLRLYTFAEVKAWLRTAGFTGIHGFDGTGGRLRPQSEWMVVAAERPGAGTRNRLRPWRRTAEPAEA